MDRILISLKKENGPRASSAPALGLNTIIFKHVYWYMQQTQVRVYRTIGPLVETRAARDLKVARYRQLMESMKVCNQLRSRSFLDLDPSSLKYQN